MFRGQRFLFALLQPFAALVLALASVGFAGAPTVAAETPSCDEIPQFDPNNFSDPTQIDNPFLPMVPGTKLILEGEANLGEGTQPHRVVFTVTDLTKVIHGVRTLVILDRDIEDEQLVERELAFFAQDDDGNVWNLGEYPEEFEDGEFIGAPSTWIAGVAGAEGGIHMKGTPVVGGPSYRQGFAPEIDFLDCARVIDQGLEVCTPFGCFKDVLLTDETSPLEEGNAHQRKYHAPGVGIVQVSAVNDPEGETLSLAGSALLNPYELELARIRALIMDRRAYRISPDVYGQTPPAEQP